MTDDVVDHGPYRIRSIKQTLKLLEEHLEKNYEDANQLDDKAKAIIGGLGLLAALVAGFRPITLQDSPTVGSFVYLLLLAVWFITLATTIINAILVLRPEKYARPMKADWDTVTSYWHLDDYALLAKLSSAYIAAVEVNLNILQRKSRYFLISATAFVATITILILLVVLR
jgi:hypothetical protein